MERNQVKQSYLDDHLILDNQAEIANKNVLMRIGIGVLTAVLIFTCLSPAGAAPKTMTAPDGSLVLGGEKNARRQKSSDRDTLYDLLGQEVQVFVFNTKTRAFRTPVYLNTRILRGGGAPWRGNANPHLEALIHKYSVMYGVDPALVRAVMRHESGFNPGAVSPKGAQGLMQLMPGTAALMGVSNPFDPEQNVAGGVGYLRRCLDRFNHNVPLAVAAYNAGPERVANCGTVPPIPETQTFVHNVMGTYGGPAKMKDTPKGKASPGDQGSDQGDKKVRRRPRPKIIEVRTWKLQNDKSRRGPVVLATPPKKSSTNSDAND